MPEEVELKLALGPSSALHLADHPLLQAAATRRTQLANTYYDTPAGDLETAKVALRIRRTPDCFLQTLKTAGQGSGGLSARGEWEWPIEADALDIDRLAALPPMQSLGQAVLDCLEARFTTDFERQTWLIEQQGACIEVALDQGEIRAGGRRVPIQELELELKSGDTAALWHLARQLAETVPLRPANASKAARGSALDEGQWLLPRSAESAAERFDLAILSLDAFIDSADGRFLNQAREQFRALAHEAETPGIAEHAWALAKCLDHDDWLTVTFGQHSLALQAALHPA